MLRQAGALGHVQKRSECVLAMSVDPRRRLQLVPAALPLTAGECLGLCDSQAARPFAVPGCRSPASVPTGGTRLGRMPAVLELEDGNLSCLKWEVSPLAQQWQAAKLLSNCWSCCQRIYLRPRSSGACPVLLLPWQNHLWVAEGFKQYRAWKCQACRKWTGVLF